MQVDITEELGVLLKGAINGEVPWMRTIQEADIGICGYCFACT